MAREYRIVSERGEDKIEQFHYVGEVKYNYIPEKCLLEDIPNEHIKIFRRSLALYPITVLETKFIAGKT